MQAFHNLLRQVYEGQNQDELTSFRAKSWHRFLELGLPKSCRNLYTGDYQPAVPKAVSQDIVARHATGPSLVLVNGQYVPKLSSPPPEIVVTPLHEAMHTYHSYLKGRWQVKSECDPFAALNGATHTHGVFLYIPPQVNTTFEVLHLLTGPGMIAAPRLHLFVGKGANISWKSSLVSQKGCWINQFTDVAIEEGASAKFSASYKAEVFDALRVTLKRDAYFKSCVMTTGNLRSDTHIRLEGENAEAALYAGARLQGSSEFEANVLVEHVAPHCRSTQLFKHVLDDQSKAQFEGKIYVHREAQQTEAFQLNNNLLVSERATVRSQPNLEIFADDVKASHGSTTGQFDPEELFYLRSRGLSESEAKSLLISAFLQPILDHA